ncbi:MAG TPA: hypothetical protein VGL55_07220 [Steroidobacteraceae bacterium]
MATDIIPRLYKALPQAKAWIDRFLAAHESTAQPMGALGSPRLAACFPSAFLERSKVVLVDRVTFPPVESFGLSEFAPLHQMDFEGITCKDTIFVRRDRKYDGLYFHELVHVAQWARLGVDDFLLIYALGLAQQSYRHTPLENLAYNLQAKFEAGTLQSDVIGQIEHLTDQVSADARQFLTAR